MAPSHYLNQCWTIVNWTPWNIFQWISIGIQTFSFKKMHLKMPSTKWHSLCLGLNVLTRIHSRINLNSPHPGIMWWRPFVRSPWAWTKMHFLGSSFAPSSHYLNYSSRNSMVRFSETRPEWVRQHFQQKHPNFDTTSITFCSAWNTWIGDNSTFLIASRYRIGYGVLSR